MGHAISTPPANSNQAGQTFKQLYELYNSTVLELEFYGRHVPGSDDIKDRKYEQQESFLMQIQDEIISYAAVRPVQTLEDAESLAALWRKLTAPNAGECSQMTNPLARSLLSFYQDYIWRGAEAKRAGLESVPA